MIITVIRTIILYILIIFALRITGKRQLSDMQPSELVITLIIADIAVIPMQNNTMPLLSGIIPMLVLVAMEIIFSVFMLKSTKFRTVVCGSPVVVIKNGEILQASLKELRMSTEDLFSQLRLQQVFSLDEIAYCIVETNGGLSVLVKDNSKDNEFETVVISDGEFLKHSLELCNTSKEKVEKILKKENTNANEVFIMTADLNGNYKIIRKDKQ